MQPVNGREKSDRTNGAHVGPKDSSNIIIGNQAAAVPALEVRGVWAGYNHQPALEDITFQVAQGDMLGVIGPNGSGKSTLLKSVLGLVEPWRGEVTVLGRSGTQNRQRIGYMPQIEQVDWDFPVTVGDVALMGRYARRGLFRRTTKEDKEAAASALERVGMQELRQKLIGELSGGQRRRVLLARALANAPDLLLLDEPMAGLDATAQHQLLDIFDDLRTDGSTIVLSTHDLSCVSGRCDQAACLNRRLIAFGPPEEILTEDILGETFGTHLLLVHLDGRAYAYQHHSHDEAPVAEPGQVLEP
ncbi:MAG: metal ABC transporter ATP-binding protein [Chloroflexi bacterium]|nr:metal ABC transporter ATP-binding protein [Chloroflexota bacterium]